jgi:hypothetical protein
VHVSTIPACVCDCLVYNTYWTKSNMAFAILNVCLSLVIPDSGNTWLPFLYGYCTVFGACGSCMWVLACACDCIYVCFYNRSMWDVPWILYWPQCKWKKKMMQCFWVYMTSKKECTIFLMFNSLPCVCDCMYFNVYCNTVNHLDQVQYNNLHCYMPVILNLCFTWLPFLFGYCFQVTHVGTYVRVWLHLRLLILTFNYKWRDHGDVIGRYVNGSGFFLSALTWVIEDFNWIIEYRGHNSFSMFFFQEYVLFIIMMI